MKKHIPLASRALLLASLCLGFSLQANTLQLRVGQKLLGSQAEQEIYGKRQRSYSFEMTEPMSPNFEAWVNGDYEYQSGNSSLGYQVKTTLMPISAGANLIFGSEEKLQPYVGAGGTYARIKIQDYAIAKPLKKWELGAVFKSGLRYRLGEQYVVSIFADYTYLKFKFPAGNSVLTQEPINMSGLSFGIGIGFFF